jgi:hypothetical protein
MEHRSFQEASSNVQKAIDIVSSYSGDYSWRHADALAKFYFSLGKIMQALNTADTQKLFCAFRESFRHLKCLHLNKENRDRLLECFRELGSLYLLTSDKAYFFRFAEGCFVGQSSPEELMQILRWISDPGNWQTSRQLVPILIDLMELLQKPSYVSDRPDAFGSTVFTNNIMKNFFSDLANRKFIEERVQELKQSDVMTLELLIDSSTTPLVAAAKEIKALRGEVEFLKGRVEALSSAKPPSGEVVLGGFFRGTEDKKRKRDAGDVAESEDTKRQRTSDSWFYERKY